MMLAYWLRRLEMCTLVLALSLSSKLIEMDHEDFIQIPQKGVFVFPSPLRRKLHLGQ